MTGPTLVSIRPNYGNFIEKTGPITVLQEQPRELTFRFSPGQTLDTSTLSGIQIVGSKFDDEFVNDFEVFTPGYIGIGEQAADVVFRFATPLPDDLYEIRINGNALGGGTVLRNAGGEAFNDGMNFTRRFDLDLGATVQAVVPQPVIRQQIISVSNAANLRDGDTVIINNGVRDVIFEFEDLVVANGISVSTNHPVTFAPGDSANVIAAELANQINAVMMTGAGATAVASGATVTVSGRAFDTRATFTTPTRSVFSVATGGLQQARDTVVVYFNKDELNKDSAETPAFYQLTDTGGTLVGTDDSVQLPSEVVYDAATNTAVLRFSAAIPTGTLKLKIGGSKESNGTIGTAMNVGKLFSNTDYATVAMIGDEGAANDIDLYRVELSAGGILTGTVQGGTGLDAALRIFDATGAAIAAPGVVNATGTGGTEVLNFTATTAGIYYFGVSSTLNVAYSAVNGTGATGGTTTGSYRVTLHVNTALTINDDNSSFGTATNLGVLGATGQTFSSQIQPQPIAIPLAPGALDEPGHRNIPLADNNHGVGPGNAYTVPSAMGVVSFYFPITYGRDPQNNLLYNQITNNQRQRTREIFEIYGDLFGFEVAETTSSGIAIITGDIRAERPEFPITVSLGGSRVLISGVPDWGTSPYGGGWMGIALHEIGHAIGLGHAFDLPSIMGGQISPEDQYPAAHDIVFGQRIRPNTGTDIDLYSFDVTQAGKVSAEIVAERLTASSSLNSVLRLYRQETDGSRTLIAQNDDYYSNDAFISMDLAVGRYFVGVSASGNMDYDPTISDTGFGGSSDGPYQLKVSIAPAVTGSSILDMTNNPLDGDGDGTPGGDYEFSFRSDTTFLVDKTVTTNLTLALNASQTLLRVRDVRMFPAAGPFDIMVDNERLTVTAIDTVNNRFTVTRAVGGTTAVAHALNAAVRPANADGTAARPYGLISEAVAAAKLGAGKIIRIVGNGGTDNSLASAIDNRPYLIGLDDNFATLEDGSSFEIPQDIVVQLDAGAIVKLKNAVIDAGTASVGDIRSGASLQVLGTTAQRVFLTSYANDLIGGDSDGVKPAAAPGDWGGLVFRQDSDWRATDAAANPLLAGIFLNYVNQADISYGGGQAFVGSTQATFSPIHMITSRPTITNNNVRFSASHAMSANPDSFDDSRGRIGPEIQGNVLTDNTINGLFVRIATALGQPVDRLNVTARFDDTDIVHVLTQNLEIAGSPGGSLNGVARIGGRLQVDPGTVIKLSGARIEAMRGSAHLIAEGTPENPIIFTSLLDDRFGAGGTFDTSSNGSTSLPSPGDWGGLIFNAVSAGSIDHALIAYGGGETPIAGGFGRFNTIEIQDRATIRIANSVLEFNANGQASGDRDGRGTNGSATIFVRQSQPVVLNNVFRYNAGSIIDINANAMVSNIMTDPGRSTGPLDVGAPFGRSPLTPTVQFADNSGPLIRLNRIVNDSTFAAINGMTIRGTTLTVESVWDDTDMVHVLRNEIIVNHHETFSGITLKSNPRESLVVKLLNQTNSAGVITAQAGFTADGVYLDTEDRIGGSVYVVGRPNFPVVLTSLNDDNVGSSLGLDGFPVTDTNNDGIATTDVRNNQTPAILVPDRLDDTTGAQMPSAGDWRSLKFTEKSNDRNVKLLFEAESANNAGLNINGNPGQAEFLGTLAPDYKSGDDNRSLGFQVLGSISADSPADVDVYSFKFSGDGAREIWIDLDRTRSASLDAVVELVQANGVVLASSSDRNTLTGLAQSLTKFTYNGDDFYTQNFRDPGMRVMMPNTGGVEGTFFIRVTSRAGTTSGQYQLQVRLQQKDEKAGSTVRYADVRYATNGVEILGLPKHSPLLGESGEFVNAAGNEVGNNNSPAAAVQLGNLLESDQTTFSIAGAMQTATDQDFFQFQIDYATTIFGGSIQAIAGVNGGPKTWSTVFDLDYANGLTRTDSNMIVWQSTPAGYIPILIGRESNIAADRPAVGQGNNLDDLSRGSVGALDPFIGPVQLPAGIPGTTTNYQVSVMTNQQLLSQLNQTYAPNPNNPLIRLEPVNSVTRVIEDHIGFQGYNSQETPILPVDLGDANPAVPDGLINVTTLSTNIQTFDLSDVPLFVSSQDFLRTYNPFFGELTTQISTTPGLTDLQTRDIAMRSDGTLWAYQRVNSANNNDNGTAGRLVRLDPGTGAVTVVGNDNVLGSVPTPGVINANVNNTNPDFDELTFSDDVDALAWERSGGVGNAARYALYYSVRENGANGSLNSKLYRANPDNGSVAKDANNQIGVRGDIQYANVAFASGDMTVMDGSGDNSSATIRVQARAAGTGGNGVQVLVGIRPVNASVNVSVNGANTVITVNVGTTATAQQIVDAINSHVTARTIVTAGLTAGAAGEVAAADPGSVSGASLSGGNNGATGPLKGNVTGMSFGDFYGDANLLSNGAALYGVTSAGEFISINTTNGQATLIRDFRATGFAGVNFTSLTLGPQNVNGGTLKNTLFALDTTGRLYAFGTGAGAPLQTVFYEGVSNIATNFAGTTGLAFSPLDFNLWHTTTRQGTEAGHGINPLYDDSRNPSSESMTVTDGQGNGRTNSQAQGGVSLYFGLERHTDATTDYLNYQDTNTQFGILNNDFQRDLTSNPNIQNNYNLPGGAYGSVITNPFDLTSNTGTASSVDAPTMYFNYFLQSEDVNTVSPDGQMRDAARVFISTNDGPWELVATNNVPINPGTGLPIVAENLFTEIPDFVSHSLNADSDNRQQQQIQPLWDNSGSWRQARVDLGKYANMTGLRLRFDFSTAGTILDTVSNPLGINANEDTGTMPQTDNQTTRLDDLDLAGGIINNALLSLDEYGNLNDSRRGQNNAFEGFYIDDIIIGWTERGEAISASTTNTAVFTVPQDPGATAPQQILTGPYQVEIRRGREFAAPADADEQGIKISETIDTNREYISGANLGLSAASDNFETENFAKLGWQPDLGDTPWRVPNIPFIDPPSGVGGSFGAKSGPISGNQESKLTTVVSTGLGVITFDYRFIPQLVGGVSNGKFQVFIGGKTDGGPAFETTTATPGSGYVTASVGVPAGTHLIEFIYSKDATGTPEGLFDPIGVYLDNVVFPDPNGGYIRCDQNLLRQQGNFVVENNIIRDVSEDGIHISSSDRESGTGMSHPGTPINFLTTNSQRLAPGVVVTNNVIARFGSDGISFGGQAVASGGVPPAAVPFGKIINNTIVGRLTPGNTIVGVRVENNASPTLLNNLIVNTNFGVFVDASSSTTVVARTYFRGIPVIPGVNTRVSGVPSGNEIADNLANRLFVNAATDNYYLAGDSNPLDGIFDGAIPIDRSLKSLADRTGYLAVKTDLGIPASDIVSPSRDAYGQLRVDDPLQPPSGVGGEIFNDVGAVERADFNGPYASIVTPAQDNSNGDLDPTLTELHVDSPPLLTQFVLSLLDLGIGVDDLSISSAQFQLWQNGLLLVENTDYLWRYNTNTNSVYFISPSVFASDNIYTIVIDNTATTGVKDLANNRLQANQADGTTKFTIVVTDGVNDAPVNTIPTLQSLNEDTFIVFSAVNGNAITVSDKDAFLGDNMLTMTIQAVHGTFSLPASSGLANLTFTAGSGTANALDTLKTFTGTIPDLNTALSGLRFVPNANYFGPAQIVITSNDRGQFSGPPSLPASTSNTVQLMVLPVNDKPTFTLLPVAQTTIITAEDSTYSMNVLTAAKPGNATDPYEAVPPVGAVDAFGVAVPAQTVTAAWTVSVPAGSVFSAANFFSSLNVDATTGLLTFTTGQDVNGTATISIELVDSLGLHSDPDTITINVTPVNDIPFYAPPGVVNITDFENQGLKTAAFVTSFAAARSTALDEIQLPANGGQTLTWTPSINLTGGNLTFDSIKVLPNGMIEYKTTKDKYGTADVTFTLTDDGGSPGVDTAATKLVQFTINEINDAPVNMVPADQSTAEDIPLIFGSATGNAIMVGDPDVALGNNTLEVTLTAVHGTVTLNGVAGLSFTVGDGTADSVMTFAGDVAAINAALNELQFIPEANYFSTNDSGLVYPKASLTVFTNDRGQFTNAGLPAQTASDTIMIDIGSINDPPTVNPLIPNLLGTLIINVDEDSGFQAYPNFLTGLSGGPPNEDQTLTSRFTFKSKNSLWTDAEFFTTAPRIIFDTATPTGRLEYEVAPNVTGRITYDIRVIDSDGLADNSPSIQQFSIDVAAINDKPTFDPVPTVPTILEDAPAQVVPLFVTNASAGPRDEDQTLTAIINVTGPLGSPTTWSKDDFFLVAPAVNMTVGSPNYGKLTYTVAPNANGTANVSILLRDTSALNSDSDLQTFNIVVTAVNDAPTFKLMGDPLPFTETVTEDAGLRIVDGFVTVASAGPKDEPQMLVPDVTVTSVTTIAGAASPWNKDNFFVVPPSVTFDTPTQTWRLQYQTGQDVNGIANVQILFRDSAGEPSAVQTFKITATPVNDKPVITLNPVVTPVMILEDAGLGTYSVVSAFASARDTALDEIGGQTPLTWLDVMPTVNRLTGNLVFDSISMLPNGQLQFQTRLNTAGSAEVTLQLRDSGSAIAPNVNLSDSVTFTIFVANVNDAPTAETDNYDIDAGESLNLNASLSTDPDLPFGDVLNYTWDLNGDGVFETNTTTNAVPLPPLSWTVLQAAGITAPAEYNASLRVTDTAGLTSTRSFSLRTRTVDYGDAPDSYGTLKPNGAAHELVGNLWLGSGVTSDFNGQPSVAANLDTDNGVIFTSLFERTTGVSLPTTMNVTASIAGKLDAWLDLNRNGIFESSEHTAYNVVAGVNALSVMIPSSASLGATYMRFRISTAGGLQPTGRVVGGEVEDYAVTITQLPTPQTPVVIKPVDFNLTDGLIPITTDQTPRIEWQNNVNNHHYTVTVRDSDGNVRFTQSNISVNQVDVTSTLLPGNYTVSVTAFDRSGDVNAPTATTTYAFTVAKIAVSAPTGDVLTHRPIVSWNAVAGSSAYIVEITSVRSGTVAHSVSLNVTTGFVPNYGVSTNLALGPYTVRVQAVDAAGLAGDWSAASAFNVRTPTTITAPINNSTLLNLRPTITWNPIFSATNYEIILTELTDNQVAYQVSGLTTTSWTPPADLRMADYYVTVRGFNVTGDSSVLSDPRLFTVNQTPVATAPMGEVGTTKPTFNWPLIAGADSFELIINRGWGNQGVVFSQIIPASNSYTLPVDLPLGNYTFTFREINFPATGSPGTQVSTAFSPPATFQITAPPVISSLTPKTASNQDWVTNSNRPTITWVNPLGAEKSTVWIKQADSTANPLVFTDVSGTSFTPPNDIGIGTYIVWVRTFSNTDNPLTAADERIPSFWSRPQRIRIVTPPVAAPVGRVETGKPTFSWTAVAGSITYDLWISNDSDGISPILRIPAVSGLSYTPTTDLPIGRYTYWVRATNGVVQNSTWSTATKFEVATAPVLSGPPQATFITKPVFTWNNMTVPFGSKTTGADSYDIVLYKINPANSRLELVQQIPGITATTFSWPTNLENGQYKAFVRAVVNAVPAITTATGAIVPAVPATITAFGTGIEFKVGGTPIVNSIPNSNLQRPVISWAGVQGATNYDVFISSTSAPNTALIRKTVLSGTTFAVTPALPGGEYRVWVRAFSTALSTFSAWSPPVTWSVVVGDVPRLTPIPNSSNRTPEISWSLVLSNPSTYEIFISRSNLPNVAVFSQSGLSGNSYTVATPLVPGEYRVWIRAFSTVDKKFGNWSTSLTWTISSTTQPVVAFESTSELVLAVLPNDLSEMPVTTTTVSLTDTDGSEFPAVQVGTVVEMVDLGSIEAPASVVNRLPAIDISTVDGKLATQETDDVLADWSEQLWWDNAKQDAVMHSKVANDASAASPTASAKILGALLMLVPKSIRRKREE